MRKNEIEVYKADDTLLLHYRHDVSVVLMHVDVDCHITDDELTVTMNDNLVCHAFKQGDDIRVICKDGVTIRLNGEELRKDE